MAMPMATAMAAAAVIRPEHAGGADLHENLLFIEKHILELFWSFVDLLDVKNGSRSKFCTRKWYRDVWKPKIKLCILGLYIMYIWP